MIHFVSQQVLGQFIDGRMNPADEDEDIPTSFELAGMIIEFIRDQEQAHRDLQQIMRERGDLKAAYDKKMAALQQDETNLKARIQSDNQSYSDGE